MEPRAAAPSGGSSPLSTLVPPLPDLGLLLVRLVMLLHITRQTRAAYAVVAAQQRRRACVVCVGGRREVFLNVFGFSNFSNAV